MKILNTILILFIISGCEYIDKKELTSSNYTQIKQLELLSNQDLNGKYTHEYYFNNILYIYAEFNFDGTNKIIAKIRDLCYNPIIDESWILEIQLKNPNFYRVRDWKSFNELDWSEWQIYQAQGCKIRLLEFYTYSIEATK